MNRNPSKEDQERHVRLMNEMIAVAESEGYSLEDLGYAVLLLEDALRKYNVEVSEERARKGAPS